MIVDTSAIIAILREEDDAALYAQSIAPRRRAETLRGKLSRMRDRPGLSARPGY